MKSRVSLVTFVVLLYLSGIELHADDSNAHLTCYDFPIATEFLLHPNLVYSKQLYPDSSAWFGEVSDFSISDEKGKPLELVIIVRQLALTKNYTKDEFDNLRKTEGIDAIDSDLGYFAVYLNMQIQNELERENFINTITNELSAEESYLATFGTPKSIYKHKNQNYPLINYETLIFGPEFIVNLSTSEAKKLRTDIPFGNKLFSYQNFELIEHCHELLSCNNRWDKSTALRCAADMQLKDSLSQFNITNDFGQEIAFSGFHGESLDRALVYIDELIDLVPENPDAHYMKTEVLFSAGRFREGVDSIQEALSLYNQKWAKESWISFSGKLNRSGMIHELIRLSQILSNYYPGDSRYLANIAASYGMLGDFDNGLAYARKVYELSPKDYINTWNLGYFLERTRSQEDPEPFYLEALSTSTGSSQHSRYQCLYADYLENQKGNIEKACELRSEHCTEVYDSKCLN